MTTRIQPNANEPKRPITIHLPETEAGIKVDSRSIAHRLSQSVNAPNAEVIAVMADEEQQLRAFATGGAELREAMIENAYPFVCLIDLLEAVSVWVFTRHDDCDAVRRSIRDSLAQRSGEIKLDVSSLCDPAASPLACDTNGAHS